MQVSAIRTYVEFEQLRRVAALVFLSDFKLHRFMAVPSKPEKISFSSLSLLAYKKVWQV